MLQQIKQNTEVAEDEDSRKIVRESIGTQTPSKPGPVGHASLSIVATVKPKSANKPCLLLSFLFF